MEKASKGLLKVSLFPSSQLGSERDMYEGAQVGTMDALIITNAALTNFVPEAAVLDQPFLFDNAEQAHKIIDGKLGDMIKENSAKKGVTILGWADSGFRDIFTAKPIKSAADLKGLKIRTMENKMHMAAYNAIGAIATPMAWGDVFTAMQQKTIDGYENSIANMYANRFYEVCKWGVRSRVHFAFQGMCISNKLWERISEEMKADIIKGVEEGCKLERVYLEEANQKYEKELIDDKGVVFIDVDRDELAKLTVESMKRFSFDKEWLDILNSELQRVKAQ
jgi:tripartite ATP-independent transporter DctP family solute receptor